MIPFFFEPLEPFDPFEPLPLDPLELTLVSYHHHPRAVAIRAQLAVASWDPIIPINGDGDVLNVQFPRFESIRGGPLVGLLDC